MSDCSKVSYPNPHTAAAALRRIASRKSARGMTGPVAIHLCASCRAWHLTSHRATGRRARGWQQLAGLTR
jgi:hypothetical protein